jgi:hypothetical protein
MAEKPTAKMAESAPGLPKWQPPANLVPNALPNWQKDFFAFGMKLYFGFFC